MKEHWNDLPGDVAAGDADNLPGGFGSYNSDLNPDATVDEVVEHDVISPTGTRFTPTETPIGTPAGTGYAEGENTGASVDPNDLVAGEEAHPGAGVGFTGAERDKGAPPSSGKAA